MYKEIINKTETYVKQCFRNEPTGHDWWHIDRVRKLSLYIAGLEKANIFIVEMAALLHDVHDWKLEHIKFINIKNFLHEINVSVKDSQHICQIIDDISFKGANYANKIHTIEGKVVQDADRLDALGAIGIARTFAYGGFKQREIYNPTIKPKLYSSFAGYKNYKSTTLNHFYEKLLLLKDKMNTPTGKKLAEERHNYMTGFLKQFLAEWEFEPTI
jgi:uncharacterized protein